ncbi:MAG: hypothetical protein ACRCWR_10920 [Saezia sp.]
METFFLRLLPYLIALFIGLVLFVIADVFIKDAALNGLLMNVAAGLLSVPMVFICYEIVKERCDRRVNESIAKHLYFDLNHSVVLLLASVAKMLGDEHGSSECLISFLRAHKKSLQKMVESDPQVATDIMNCKNDIDRIIHNSNHLEVLGNDDIHLILAISKRSGMVSRELQSPMTKAMLNQVTESVTTLLDLISQWSESQKEEFTAHESIKLMEI